MSTFLAFIARGVLVAFAALIYSAPVLAQEMQTPDNSPPAESELSSVESLFGEKMPFMIVPTIRATPTGAHWGAMWGAKGGALVNKNFMVGLGTFASLSHPELNVGYTGLLVEYRYMPHRLVHFGGSLLVGYGSVTRVPVSIGFLSPIQIVWENTGRLFNPQFFVAEPSVFGEINLSSTIALSLGASYRWVSGLEEDLSSGLNSPTNQTLSSPSIDIGLRFRIDGAEQPAAPK
jgi:hypothetical protein